MGEEWKVLDITYVVYKEGSVVSQALFATLTPIFAKFCIVGAFAVTRRIEWIWTLAGALFVDVACLLLKDIINQPRPLGSYKDGPGMPSEHAAVAAFYATHLSLHLARRVHGAQLLKAVLWVTLAAWVAIVAASRQHLRAHSAAQLAV